MPVFKDDKKDWPATRWRHSNALRKHHEQVRPNRSAVEAGTARRKPPLGMKLTGRPPIWSSESRMFSAIDARVVASPGARVRADVRLASPSRSLPLRCRLATGLLLPLTRLQLISG